MPAAPPETSTAETQSREAIRRGETALTELCSNIDFRRFICSRASDPGVRSLVRQLAGILPDKVFESLSDKILDWDWQSPEANNAALGSTDMLVHCSGELIVHRDSVCAITKSIRGQSAEDIIKQLVAVWPSLGKAVLNIIPNPERPWLEERLDSLGAAAKARQDLQPVSTMHLEPEEKVRAMQRRIFAAKSSEVVMKWRVLFNALPHTVTRQSWVQDWALEELGGELLDTDESHSASEMNGTPSSWIVSFLGEFREKQLAQFLDLIGRRGQLSHDKVSRFLFETDHSASSLSADLFGNTMDKIFAERQALRAAAMNLQRRRSEN